MSVIILKLMLSVFLTLFVILCIVAGIYWFLLVSSLVAGLLGMQVLSVWFRTKMDAVGERIKRVYKTIARKGK